MNSGTGPLAAVPPAPKVLESPRPQIAHTPPWACSSAVYVSVLMRCLMRGPVGIDRQQKLGPGESLWIGVVALRSIKLPRRGRKAGTRTRVMRRGGMSQDDAVRVRQPGGVLDLVGSSGTRRRSAGDTAAISFVA